MRVYAFRRCCLDLPDVKNYITLVPHSIRDGARAESSDRFSLARLRNAIQSDVLVPSIITKRSTASIIQVAGSARPCPDRSIFCPFLSVSFSTVGGGGSLFALGLISLLACS